MSIEYYIINKCKRISQPSRTPVFSKLFTSSIINITNCILNSENLNSTENVSTSDSLSTSGGASISGGANISSTISNLVLSNITSSIPTLSLSNSKCINTTSFNYFTKSIIIKTILDIINFSNTSNRLFNSIYKIKFYHKHFKKQILSTTPTVKLKNILLQ